MVRALLPTGAGSPKYRGEGQHRKKKEGSRHLQPDLSSDRTEGLEKAGHTPAQIPAGQAGSGNARSGARLASVAPNLFAGNTSGDSQSDSESPANGFGFHFDMMVSVADPARSVRIQRPKAVALSPSAQ